MSPAEVPKQVSKHFTPRAYQEAGTRFILNNKRCNLHVDMGLGKSVMVLNAIDALLLCGEPLKVLILAPLRVARSTWSDEAKKWDHLSDLKISPIVGTVQEREEALNRYAHIYTCNYEILPWLVDRLKGNWPFNMVVADESSKLKSNRVHTRLKGNKRVLYRGGGKRTSALATVAFKEVKRFVNLTGTPAPNSLADLWGQHWYIDMGRSLGYSHSSFMSRWYRLGRNGYSYEPLGHSDEEIRSLISATTFTLRAEDYLSLGEEIVNTIFVDLPDKARKQYKEMEKKLYTVIKAGGVEAVSAGVKSMKCHQMANGALYHDEIGSWEELHTVKIEALQEVIEEAQGTPVIVCYKFKSDLARLKKAFPSGVAFDTNRKTEYDFKQGLIPILFVHPDSAGHGIDFMQHVTNIICFFSLDWNAENREQVIARIGKVRQFQAGYDRPVFIHQIVARGTVDEDILRRVGSKLSVQDALKEGLARRLTGVIG